MSLFAWYTILYGCGHQYQERLLRLRVPGVGRKKVCPICGKYGRIRAVAAMRYPTA